MRGERGRGGLVLPRMSSSRRWRVDLISDGSAYRIELELDVVVVLAVFVALVAVGFILAIEAGLKSSLPEMVDCRSDRMCDSVVDRRWIFRMGSRR